MNLISVKDLIKQLKEKNINLGKGDPYNRLRYYTKIGWIDHMIRKKDSNGIVSGHFPTSVIEKIIIIENLKKEGKSNEEISDVIKKKNVFKKIENFAQNTNNLKDSISESIMKKIKETNFSFSYLILCLIIIGLIYELGNSNSRYDKKILELNTVKINEYNENGYNYIPSGKNKILINNKNVKKTSQIVITFEANIAPATFYYVSEKIENEGFILETNFPVKEDAKFSYTILN